MIQNHIIMIINAVILIAGGLIGYFSSGSPTAFIAPGIGIIIFILALAAKNNNAVSEKAAIILSLVAAVTFIIIGIRRGNAMVIGMGIITFICFDYYILKFILQKNKKAS